VITSATSTPSGNVFEARGLTKTYGTGVTRFDALRGIDLDIANGESVAIVGKSGSGKSTLMHILALLDSPTEGSLRVAGRDAKSLKTADLNRLRNQEFGFVFQQFFMIPNASVLENVVMPLKIAGMAASERRARGMEVLDLVEMTDKANNRATNLSGGQKQRMVIARALANRPRAIFADEPTGNLDSTTGQVIEDLLFDLNAKQGITLVIVTHDEELAARCQRRVYVKDGLVVDAGDVKSTSVGTTGVRA
jgi:putative ABC transport system ATP-binding protein